jgi:hypothetical protein
MHIQMNVAVVLEGPYPGKGELESMAHFEKTLGVENLVLLVTVRTASLTFFQITISPTLIVGFAG